jgi:hypothetical protein
VQSALDFSNGSGSVTAALVTTTGAIGGLPGPAPRGTPLATFEFTPSADVTFSAWNDLLTTITIEPMPTAGHTFEEYGYDLTSGVAQGENPGPLSGNTVSFGSGFGPVTLLPHHYAVVLVMN